MGGGLNISVVVSGWMYFEFGRAVALGAMRRALVVRRVVD